LEFLMLRSRCLALACLAALSSHSANADPAIVVAPSAASASDASAAKPAEAATVPEARAAKDTSAPEKPEVKPEVKSEAAAKPAPPPEPTLTAKIDLAKQTMVVAEDGDVKYSWPISSGAEEFPTPRGTFRPQWVAKMWYSRKYDNAPMPNAVFISGGVAIHATQHVGSLGRPASHGCIRLAPGNAKTFYGLVGKHGLKMTRVSIYGNPKWRSAPAVANRDAPSRKYAARQQDSGSWFSSPKQYRQVSAYDPGFTQRQYRQVYRPAPRGYYYGAAPPRVYYQRRSQDRVVYVQRPQRRYYYNSSGYGYGGGW
jgi:lipoprotein-anchoring transpeptidase ErfK/SrfK